MPARVTLVARLTTRQRPLRRPFQRKSTTPRRVNELPAEGASKRKSKPDCTDSEPPLPTRSQRERSPVPTNRPRARSKNSAPKRISRRRRGLGPGMLARTPIVSGNAVVSHTFTVAQRSRSAWADAGASRASPAAAQRVVSLGGARGRHRAGRGAPCRRAGTNRRSRAGGDPQSFPTGRGERLARARPGVLAPKGARTAGGPRGHVPQRQAARGAPDPAAGAEAEARHPPHAAAQAPRARPARGPPGQTCLRRLAHPGVRPLRRPEEARDVGKGRTVRYRALQ